jgi:acyl dehydratase
MQVGDVTSWERTFTREDVEQFGRISGDLGEHHVTPDAQGRLMVQGLLTATLPTKLGGDINFLARELSFEFLRPVFTGDTIYCENTITLLEQREGRTYLESTSVCRNQHGKEVLICRARGIVRTVA